ncbi:glutathione S-transferase [Lasiosphaeria hispida]|uniref:Glutathione S-transferase n=1 Tax=Lasiosphaeria hispida TaxID=260671 RepID=A0AAJ0HTI6_9PEZI|nr:glutathione S-transferase [Lasiosphaeria hispida]
MAAVDTSLLPSRPTGAAASLAAAHAAEHPLKLYGGWFCPFVQRAWIVLVEKGIGHQYVEINPYHKAPEFLALNPRGLVPTLAVPPTEGRKETKPLYESSVVCEYLDEAYPEQGPRLLPVGDVYERARCRLWMDHVASRVVPGFYRLMQHTPEKAEGIDEVRRGFHEQLKAFVREMDEGGPWFLGDRFSLVDIMLAPWAKRLFLIDHYKPGGVGIPRKGERGGDEEVWARWDNWFDAIVDRQSVKDTWSDEGQYIEAYKRYAEDTTQSEVGKATRQGTSLP